jgi:hypothetical protein
MQSRIPFDVPGSEQIPATAVDSSQLDRVCRETLRAMFPSFGNVEISSSFYPYVGLTHTIRRRGSAWLLRISDHCLQAPHQVLQAVAILLACRVLRRRPPDEWLQVYEAFRRAPAVEASVRERRLRRGRKVLLASGKHHSLRGYFQEVNRRFFNGQVDITEIGWSRNRSWSRLGHYDPVHRTITISAALDSEAVPPMVLSYLVYHEMLHAVFDVIHSGSRRRHHPRAFREAERAHPDFAEASRFLNEFCRGRGGKRPRRACR